MHLASALRKFRVSSSEFRVWLCVLCSDLIVLHWNRPVIRTRHSKLDLVRSSRAGSIVERTFVFFSRLHRIFISQPVGIGTGRVNSFQYQPPAREPEGPISNASCHPQRHYPDGVAARTLLREQLMTRAGRRLVPKRPRGMHQRTFDRLLAELRELEKG